MRSILFTLFFMVFTATIANGQEIKTFYSVQAALDHHISELKTNIRKYDNIFIVSNLGDNLKIEDVFQVDNSLNAKFLKKGCQSFLVKVSLDVQSNPLKIGVANFRIIKQSNKKIKLVNLGNGDFYFIK